MKLVDSAALLEEAAAKISHAPWAAIDTEADSLHHYAEKLSLVQVSIPGEDYVIDPLAKLDLAPLFAMMSEKYLLFHAADSDVRLMKKVHPFRPREIFDTLLAAQILGYPKMGLVDLVERHCGLRLSKAEQKADWSRRPLTEKMLAYAVGDTKYLKTLQEAMERELAELGRLDWHRQQCAKLLQVLEQVREEERDPSSDWQIKGSKELKGLALTILKELWHWREELAQKRDRPPFKILNSEYLVQIARWAEANPAGDIGQWKEGPRNARGEHRDAINKLIRDAQNLPQAEYRLPERTKPRIRWTEKDSKILNDLKAVREKLAGELKVHPSLIATNAILEAVVLAKPKTIEDIEKKDLLLPWQIEAAGEALLQPFKTG